MGIYRTMPAVVFAGDQGFLQVEFSRNGLEKIVVEVLHQTDYFAALEQFLGAEKAYIDRCPAVETTCALNLPFDG